jgi:hypothetical protein
MNTSRDISEGFDLALETEEMVTKPEPTKTLSLSPHKSDDINSDPEKNGVKVAKIGLVGISPNLTSAHNELPESKEHRGLLSEDNPFIAETKVEHIKDEDDSKDILYSTASPTQIPSTQSTEHTTANNHLSTVTQESVSESDKNSSEKAEFMPKLPSKYIIFSI